MAKAANRGQGKTDTTPPAASRQPAMAAIPARADIVIAGGGLVGLSLGLALKQLSAGSLSLVIVDPLGGVAPKDTRSSAIAAGARRMLDQLGAWPTDKAQPILDMIVTDGRVEDGVRPTILAFDGEAEPGEPFAHMIENAVLLGALYDRAIAESISIITGHVAGVERGPGQAVVTLSGGETILTPLVAACDGGKSRLREQAGMRMVGWDYRQAGISTTVWHERAHNGRAEEHFLPAGPFAILPLIDDSEGRHRSSIVWTEERAEADRLVGLDDAGFLEALVERFGYHLGDVGLAGQRRAHPLGHRTAREFAVERLALVGDAAHIIHPIAGQGLNLGLKDVAALADVIMDAQRLGEDFGTLGVLDRYAGWRRFDTAAMGVTTDVLNRLFSNDIGAVRAVRSFGLGLVERLPPVKSLLMRNAAGLTGTLPSLMRAT
jgi:2-octaprenyl-6-methoxyphenol hydroxylase